MALTQTSRKVMFSGIAKWLPLFHIEVRLWCAPTVSMASTRSASGTFVSSLAGSQLRSSRRKPIPVSRAYSLTGTTEFVCVRLAGTSKLISGSSSTNS